MSRIEHGQDEEDDDDAREDEEHLGIAVAVLFHGYLSLFLSLTA